ncbi:MAG: hypothetical protein IM600_02875 [Bacteroidetes bacterium]|nr:hypothetical protein [Bacteroidota bacterium]MCA6442349.1 hypothetical protein [Bacteroidota bacterium]
MKNTFFLINLILVVNLNAKTILSLKKALELKFVSAKATNNGGYQGDCMLLTLTNFTKDSLEVQLEPGFVFNSKNDSKQDIIVTREEFFVLGSQSSISKKIKGYCCQAGKSAPSSGEAYTFNFNPAKELTQLALFLNKNKFLAQAEQQAIWAISDNKNTANITGNNDSIQMQLRHYVAKLKGEPIPWYVLETKTIHYSSGNMETLALNLKGDLTFSMPNEAYAMLHVLNSKGEEVCKIIHQYLKASPNLTLPVKFSVSGLKKGKYKVELKTKNNAVCEREFEIT